MSKALRIPDKIKIGAMWFKIKIAKLDDMCGYVCRKTNTIWLDSEISHDIREQTLLHEIEHVFGGEKTEQIVDSDSFHWHQVLKDNGLWK